MSGASDCPAGIVADETAPPAGDGENLNVDALLHEVEAIHAPQTMHDLMAQHLRGIVPNVSENGRTVLVLDDAQAWVAGQIRERTGRDLGVAPTWIRLVRTDLRKGALFVVHNGHSCNEAELLVAADRGVISRAMIEDVCRWAFYGLGLWRLVLRIPDNCSDLSDLARRARFRFEGTSRLFFGGVIDAHVWAMTGPDCPWLKPRRAMAKSETRPAPVLLLPPPSSFKVH